ncbi:M20/M25/M40 family metallo-hydrolase [Nonomuraea sp. LPB2021202275-12-8]|uniref:M20/M25/M40 family metallo-hydrolase n=1 Tax=Nonomuraea sp. LPB2021202275-12-8 TaxID=3120159 RepID=UPI00300D9679
MTRTALAGLVALAALLAVTLLDLAPPAPSAAGAPATAFSATRAHEHVRAIARAPHPTGSAEHTRVREHLVAKLRELGLDVRVQEGVGVLPLRHDGVIPMGTMRNIVATRPGGDPTGRVILAAHYDSVPAGPGASDDGAGVATILEVARALPAGLRNDVVLLITDGEEQGLLGAEAFVRQDPLAKGTVVVLNNEARGIRGAVQMFRASPGSAPLIDLYGSAAPHASADSAFAALLSVLPNNTDFHVFDEAGWLGLDSAFIGGGAYYHTPLDDPAHLDLGSLQMMGDNALALTRALAGADLATLRSGSESVYFTVPGALVRYPLWLEIPIAAGALALAAALVWTLRRRGQTSLPRTAAAAGLALLPVLGAAGAGFAVMPVLSLIRPEYGEMLTGDPYRPWFYQAALLVFTVGIVLAWRLALRRLGLATLAAGALLLLAVLGLASAVLLPGGSHTLTWSALFAALGLLVSARLRGDGWAAVALILGLAPATILLGATAVTALDVGLGLGGMIAAPHFALLVMLLLPLSERSRPRTPAEQAEPPRTRRRAVLPLLTAVALTAGLVVTGLYVDRFDAAHPRQTRLAYAMDAATGQAVWGARSESAGADSERFFADDGWATRPAQAAGLRAPELSVAKDETAGGRRTLTLRLKPTGEAPITGLRIVPGEGPAGATGTGSPAAPAAAPGTSSNGSITVNGRRLSTSVGFAYHAPPGTLEVTLVLPPGPARIRAFEQSHDLSVVPGHTPVPGTISMSPLATVFQVHTL